MPGKPMSWGMIVAVLIGTGLVVGLTLGLLRETLGLNPGAGVGVAIGVVAARLIMWRRQAMAGPPASGRAAPR